MGPGSLEQAHTAREFVEIRQVEAMADFFVRLLESAPA
jgi:acetylornithine deacetylase/succinyl-diaminopimelate desuccinylase-like protein